MKRFLRCLRFWGFCVEFWVLILRFGALRVQGRMRTILVGFPLALSALAFALAACGGGGGADSSGGSSSSGGGGSPPDGMFRGTDNVCGATADVKAAPTWAEDIAPIVMKNCAGCHREGGIAPFALLTYEQVKPLAALMADRTASREMPPLNPNNCGTCNTYKEVHWLSTEEIALVGAWADSGALSGDLSVEPPTPVPPTGLTEANTTIKMTEAYTPNASKSDDYRCFVVDPGNATDQFLTAYEVLPGDSRVVHHVIAFALDTAQADADAAALDAAEAGPGYTCFGGPNVTASTFVAGWAPGGQATRFPTGTGIKVKGGRKMVLQVHYNLAGGAFPDQTSMKVVLADTVQKEAMITRVSTNKINLPPGQPLTEVTDLSAVPAGAGKVTLWGVAPHMHGAGKTLHVESDQNGTKQCLVDVGNWDFHWQSFSFYENPVTVNGGDTIKLTCGYDTTGRSTVTTAGEGTENEMCIAFFYATL